MNKTLYRGFDADNLEREYSPSSCVGGDISGYLERYAAESAAARAELACQLDLRYGTADDEVLDLFLPSGPGPHPLHLFIHGGYWQALSHKEAATLARPLVARGIAYAALNYRIAPAGTLEQMVAQCHQALAWLARQATTYRLDVGRFTASGHSAGAHLLSMMMTRPVPLVGALLISGVYDLQPIILTSINAPLGLNAARAEALSPLRLPIAQLCPVRVTVGENETSEFHRQAREMALHLAAEGCPTALAIHAGSNHFDIILSERTAQEIAVLTLGSG